MPDVVNNLHEWLKLCLTVAAVGALIGTWLRWGHPRLTAHLQRERDRDVVLLGRPAIPANPVTGEPGQPAIEPVGQVVADLVALVREIHHELHPNGGSSLADQIGRMDQRLQAGDRRFEGTDHRLDSIDRRLGRIEGAVADELALASDTLANAAAASRIGLETIHDAILATPPETADLD